MGIYKDFAKGADGSHYVVMDWEIVAKYLDYLIWKASEGESYRDETFPGACQAAYDRRIPFGAYHFFRVDPYLGLPYPSKAEIINQYWPTPEKDKQLQNFIGALKNKTFNFLAVDVEATKELASGKLIDPAWAAAAAKIFIGRVGDWMWKTNGGAHPGMPLVVYTSNGYIGTYAPGLAEMDWSLYGQWVAQWSVYPKNTTTLTWEQQEANYLPGDASKPRPFGNGTVKLWQYSADRLILPGMYTSDGKTPRTTDLNLFMGSPAAFRAWCHYDEPATPPTPPDEPTPDLTAVLARLSALEARLAQQEQHTHTATTVIK
jgi:GH25 family lysozyme M1 (1,4-beta-N-acetylmuramidase)